MISPLHAAEDVREDAAELVVNDGAEGVVADAAGEGEGATDADAQTAFDASVSVVQGPTGNRAGPVAKCPLSWAIPTVDRGGQISHEVGVYCGLRVAHPRFKAASDPHSP